MVTASEIGWGSYRQYEGPFYRGKCGYVLPPSPTGEEMIMAVITATEGGHYDAWNGYDVCGWTSGLIQWCERGQYSVSDMLSEVDLGDSDALKGVRDYGAQFGIMFGRANLEGKFAHRFFFQDGEGVIDTQAEQRRLFYQHGDGTKGSWTEATKAYAKGWAAAISSVWESPAAQAVQVDYTVKRLGGFMLPLAKKLFASAPATQLAAAARAAYLSFAANNPSWADKSLHAVVDATSTSTWSLEWLIAVLRELTFGPKIAIYPARYNAIRPVLERLYGVELPDFAVELERWSAATGIPATIDTRKLQGALKSLGYDLGPAGVDGIYGKKTREAVLTLEQLSGVVPVENQDGLVDVHTWPALQAALKAKGLPGLPGLT